MRKSYNVQSLKNVTGLREKFPTLHKDLCTKRRYKVVRNCVILVIRSSASTEIDSVEHSAQSSINLQPYSYFTVMSLPLCMLAPPTQGVPNGKKECTSRFKMNDSNINWRTVQLWILYKLKMLQ